jgi:hypothetical protein
LLMFASFFVKRKGVFAAFFNVVVKKAVWGVWEVVRLCHARQCNVMMQHLTLRSLDCMVLTTTTQLCDLIITQHGYCIAALRLRGKQIARHRTWSTSQQRNSIRQHIPIAQPTEQSTLPSSTSSTPPARPTIHGTCRLLPPLRPATRLQPQRSKTAPNKPIICATRAGLKDLEPPS